MVDVKLPPMPELPDREDRLRWLAWGMRIALMERERCARVCETLNHGAFGPAPYLWGVRDGSAACGSAIRKGTAASRA